jgi:hypothetical protein
MTSYYVMYYDFSNIQDNFLWLIIVLPQIGLIWLQKIKSMLEVRRSAGAI